MKRHIHTLSASRSHMPTILNTHACIHVCICACTHACTNTCICQIHECAHAYIHHMHTHKHIHTHACTHTRTRANHTKTTCQCTRHTISQTYIHLRIRTHVIHTKKYDTWTYRKHTYMHTSHTLRTFKHACPHARTKVHMRGMYIYIYIVRFLYL